METILNRKLAAVLFADIVGYTALMQKDEATASTLLRRFQKNIEEKIPKYNGRVINFYGDGVLCIFDNPLEAVRCAMILQNNFSESPNVPVRIGLHSGTVVIENEKIYGDSVNLASRIESIGVPGAILLSKKIRDEIKNQPDIRMTSLGNFMFKNVEEVMEVFALANEGFPIPKREEMKGKVQLPAPKKISWLIAVVATVLFLMAIGFWKMSSTNNTSKTQSTNAIGVLQFSNTKPDNETNYLGFAIANQVIGELAYLKNIAVRPSASIRKYERQVVDPIVVGNELGVDYILIGNYLNEANSIRLTIELVEVNTNEMIWREEIDVDFHDVFDLQDIVAKKVVDRLNVQLTQKEEIRIGKDIPSDPLAYEYYLRGVSYPLSNEGDDLAIKMLNRSVELDSNYAPAYYHLGIRTQRITQFGMRDSEDAERAEAFYLKALSINSELLGVLGDLAMLYTEIGRTNEAVELGRKMLKINPNNANAHFSLSYTYRYAGMINESYREMEKTLAIDSKNPRFRRLGLTCTYYGDIERASAVFDLDRGSAYALSGQGRDLLRQGKTEEALELFDRVIAMEPEVSWIFVITALKSYILQDSEKGLQAVKSLEEANPPDGEALYFYSSYAALLGDNATCLRLLQKAVDRGYFNYPFMLTDSFLDSMRDHTEFQKILIEAKSKHDAFTKRFF